MEKGWVRISRKIFKWRWYKDIITRAIFIHLIAKANYEDADYKDTTVHRGEMLTSYDELAAENGVNRKTIIKALKKLQKTGEIKVESRPHIGTRIQVMNYDTYQPLVHKMDGSMDGSMDANKKNKEYKNKRSNNNTTNTRARIPTIGEVEAYIVENDYHFDPLDFYEHYDGHEWQYHGKPIDWKKRAKLWEEKEQKEKKKSSYIDFDTLDYGESDE